MTSRAAITKEIDTIVRDVENAFETYTEIIDVLGPYIEADEEGQEVLEHSTTERFHLYQYVYTPS